MGWALTNVPGSPLTQTADQVIVMGNVPDSGVYVTGYTGTVAALALIGQWWGVPGAAQDLDAVAELLPGVIEQARLAGQALSRLRPEGPRQVDAVGDAESGAAAHETALLLREAARIPSAAFALTQYLHGPAESLEGGLLVVFGPDHGLVAGLIDRAAVLHIAPAPNPRATATVTLPHLAPLATAILESVVGQVLACALGGRGFEIGTFRAEFAGTKITP